MFRVTFVTKNEKLGDALQSLVGVAVGQPDVVPIHDVEVRHGRLKGAPLTAAALAQQLPRQFTTRDVKVVLKRIGRTPYANQWIKDMLAERLVSRVGKRGKFQRKEGK